MGKGTSDLEGGGAVMGRPFGLHEGELLWEGGPSVCMRGSCGGKVALQSACSSHRSRHSDWRVKERIIECLPAVLSIHC